MTMHKVEAFTGDLWICTGCGNLFDRHPSCDGCTQDPMMQNHRCEFEEAIIEGDCETDPVLVTEGEDA